MLELRARTEGKEYTSKDEKHNYFYITGDKVLHGVDGEKFAAEYSCTGFYVVTDEMIEVANGYPQYKGDSIIIHGVEGDNLIVQYGDTKETRGYKKVNYKSDRYLEILADAYSQLIQTF